MVSKVAPKPTQADLGPNPTETVAANARLAMFGGGSYLLAHYRPRRTPTIWRRRRSHSPTAYRTSRVYARWRACPSSKQLLLGCATPSRRATGSRNSASGTPVRLQQRPERLVTRVKTVTAPAIGRSANSNAAMADACAKPCGRDREGAIPESGGRQAVQGGGPQPADGHLRRDGSRVLSSRTRFLVRVQPDLEDKRPDMADILYQIHRRSHGHDDEPFSSLRHGARRQISASASFRVEPDRFSFPLPRSSVCSPSRFSHPRPRDRRFRRLPAELGHLHLLLSTSGRLAGPLLPRRQRAWIGTRRVTPDFTNRWADWTLSQLDPVTSTWGESAGCCTGAQPPRCAPEREHPADDRQDDRGPDGGPPEVVGSPDPNVWCGVQDQVDPPGISALINMDQPQGEVCRAGSTGTAPSVLMTVLTARRITVTTKTMPTCPVLSHADEIDAGGR